jgi:hypothetical protein
MIKEDDVRMKMTSYPENFEISREGDNYIDIIVTIDKKYCLEGAISRDYFHSLNDKDTPWKCVISFDKLMNANIKFEKVEQ